MGPDMSYGDNLDYCEYLINSYDILDLYNKRHPRINGFLCEGVVIEKILGISTPPFNSIDYYSRQEIRKQMRHSLRKEYERYKKINSIIYDIY